MKHIQLKFISTIKRYTTASVTDIKAIQDVNNYPTDHPDYKKENRNMYITYERMVELQPLAIENGYLFTF